MSALTQIGFVLSVSLAAVFTSSETTPWLELIRDGYEAQKEEIREVVRASFPTKSYEPGDTAAWRREYESWRKIAGR